MPALTTLVSRVKAARAAKLSLRKYDTVSSGQTPSIVSSASSTSLTTAIAEPALVAAHAPALPPRRNTQPTADTTHLVAWTAYLSTAWTAFNKSFYNVGYDARYLFTHFVLGTERFFALTMVAANLIAVVANVMVEYIDESALPLNRLFGLYPVPTGADGFFLAQAKWGRVLAVSGRPYAFGILRSPDDILAELVPASSIPDLGRVAVDYTREMVYFYGLMVRAALHMVALALARAIVRTNVRLASAIAHARAAAPNLIFDAQHALRRDARLLTSYLSGSPIPYRPMPASLSTLFVDPGPAPTTFPPLRYAYGYSERHYLADVAERVREWQSYPRLNVIQRAKERKAGWVRYWRKRLDRDFDAALIPALGVRVAPLPDGPGVLRPRPIDELWTAHSIKCSHDLRRAVWDLYREQALRDIYPPAEAWKAMHEEERRARHAGIGRSVPEWEF